MLYISCHTPLEYNEVSLFNEIGIDVFCIGSYMNPAHPQDSFRPPMEISPKPELIKLACPKDALTKELVDNFDIIYVMHIPEWIVKNWNVIKDKIVIWRSIGQSISNNENELKPFAKNIKIVRYSPFERNIPNYNGEDAIIRFHLDSEEFKDWNGNVNKIATVANSMKKRGVACSYTIFEAATRGLPRVLYGPGNEGDLCGGMLSYDDLKKTLRNFRVYFYTGTHPASYTMNFMEAFMTGMPVVAIGNKYGNGHYFNQNTYEVPYIIQNGINGFCSDDINTLHDYCKNLLKDENLAKQISIEGRKTAIEYFGKDKIKSQWETFFRNIKT